MITVDRVLKVNFSIKYNLFVTKRKLLLVCMCCWLISAGHGCTIWFVPNLLNKVFLVWEIFLIFFIVASYVYIFIYLRITRKNVLGDNVNSGRAISLNLRVPTMILSTFIVLFAIPDMLLATNIAQYNSWFSCVFTMNIFSDAIIYIFGTPKLRKSICCCP